MLIGKQNNAQSAFAHLTSTVSGGNRYENLGTSIGGYLTAITTTPTNNTVSTAYNNIVQQCETMGFDADDADAIAKAACLAFCIGVMAASGVTAATPGQAQSLGTAAATAAATEILSLCGCDSGCSPDSIAIAAGLGAGLAFFSSPGNQTKVIQNAWGQLMAIGLLQ